VQDFRKLKVWEKSHMLVMEIYKYTRTFPAEEMYCITSQIRRTAISIPSNIAEGCGRGSDAEFAYFIQIAIGSASELEYQTFLSFELGYLNKETSNELINTIITIKRMLTTLKKTLKAER
jgi:four helix bundle protein